MSGLVAHQGDVPGMVEELVDHAKGAAGRAAGRGMVCAINEADEVQHHHGTSLDRLSCPMFPGNIPATKVSFSEIWGFRG